MPTCRWFRTKGGLQWLPKPSIRRMHQEHVNFAAVEPSIFYFVEQEFNFGGRARMVGTWR